jgi:hypothetical protein
MTPTTHTDRRREQIQVRLELDAVAHLDRIALREVDPATTKRSEMLGNRSEIIRRAIRQYLESDVEDVAS